MVAEKGFLGVEDEKESRDGGEYDRNSGPCGWFCSLLLTGDYRCRELKRAVT